MNKIEIYGVSIPICFVFVSLLINSSYAQSTENFKTYTNNDMGFTIQYPSNWLVDEEYSPKFLIPDRAFDASFFAVYVEEPESYLDTDTMTLKNTSLQQHVQEFIDIQQSQHGSNLIRQNEVTVGGNTGIKTELTDDLFGYTFHIFTIANGKVYHLFYAERPLKVPETLPLANKMVESFQVIK